MAQPDIEKQPPTALEDEWLDEKSPSQYSEEIPDQQARRSPFLRLALTFLAWMIVFNYTHITRFFPSQKLVFPFPRHQLTIKEREELFLSVPNEESAIEASLAYATHPHLAGSTEDELDAKTILHLFQDELNIQKPAHLPIYKAGSEASRNATLLLSTSDASNRPNAWIDTYYPVMNTGTDQYLEILDSEGKALWAADLVEDGDPRDSDAHKYRDTIPAWHGLSAEGDAAGQLVYANYGLKEDYDELVARGTNLTGKVVITRYGRIFRGLKIKRAQELGAVGVLIYSDPRDDGYVTEANDYPPYPAGPARNPTSVQRGSVQFLSIYPGDPTTPGYPSYEDAERTDGTNIPKIPSLPISWNNAHRLLQEIGNIYHEKDGKKVLSGNASERNIRIANYVDTRVTPIWNAMASIPGHIKNEVVVIGCHRDAWVMGAADPTSGTVSLHEIVRGFGALLRKGWKPLRTIVIASWDAEEYGLIGSTEWGEDFAPWISDHVVAYLNVDVSVDGSRFNVQGSPSLAHLIKKTASDVPHPTKKDKTLWDAIYDEGPYTDLQSLNATVDADVLETFANDDKALKASDTQVRPLGSGSDYTVFLQRLGVASSDQGFVFTPSDAVYHYHSIYDTHTWQLRYGDHGFHRHVAIAKHLGLLALRLSDALVLPLNTTQYSLELEDYLTKVEDLVPSLEKEAKHVHLSSLRHAIHDLQEASAKLDKEKQDAEEDFIKLLKKMHFPPRQFARTIKRGRSLYRQVKDAIKQVFGVSPPTDTQLHLLSLRHAESWEEFMEYVSSLDHNICARRAGLPHPIRRFIRAAKRVGAANKKLVAFERGFIHEDGIKDREWYRHLGVAPGKWLGYGATTLPALTESITIEKNLTLVRHEAGRLEALIRDLAKNITP
ncbi:hypothetical protein CPB83DRAFT_842921 [Crepidotus variabilis]|uniref:Zn-dependent exopeptidase n=1 Tax=Crepidotus variabilis TaxID=179855 RepID=A0A9P6ERI7_9AGAR|nr:hypothetical protein CPB83DRAFT_842921 [Crepidotus variabilis]